MKNSVKKLLVFDFDGTIADTSADIIHATHLLFDKKGIARVEDHIVEESIGMGFLNLLQKVLPEGTDVNSAIKELYNEFIEIYDSHYLDNIQVFSGFEDFLKAWDGQVAIISNKIEKYVVDSIYHLKMDHYPWEAIIGGDTFHVAKPDAYVLQEVMKKAGVTPLETVMIGDGLPDVLVAKNAGVDSIAVEFGYSPIHELRNAGAEHTLDHYCNLFDCLDVINAKYS
ncbi:MAG: HAD family hydrolase [Bdellovibrionales bacterium]|nr:HAD family hydrolase [Bdellovibrionales bacterium]